MFTQMLPIIETFVILNIHYSNILYIISLFSVLIIIIYLFSIYMLII